MSSKAKENGKAQDQPPAHNVTDIPLVGLPEGRGGGFNPFEYVLEGSAEWHKFLPTSNLTEEHIATFKNVVAWSMGFDDAIDPEKIMVLELNARPAIGGQRVSEALKAYSGRLDLDAEAPRQVRQRFRDINKQETEVITQNGKRP